MGLERSLCRFSDVFCPESSGLVSMQFPIRCFKIKIIILGIPKGADQHPYLKNKYIY